MQNTNQPNRSARRSTSWLVSLALLAALLSGCSRSFWRLQADRDTYDVLAHKMTDPRWNLPRVDVQPDPRSRFYDPYDPDRGPLTPDDPAAAEYMRQVSGIKGYKSWHKLGESFSIENPQWIEPFGLVPGVQTADYNVSEDGSELKPGIQNLTLQQALELSYIHSRDYQTEIEDAYLSALDLTFDRFQFDVRYLGIGGEPGARLTHRSVPHGQNSLAFNPRGGIRQMLPAGGQWAVELANNTLWLFSGSNQTTSASVLSYSLVQPLLMGAGRKVVLEDLTQGERNVLYATRDLARFRKVFFTDTSSSYLDLLLSWQNVLNRRDNIRRTERQLEVLRGLASQRPNEIFEPLDALPVGLQLPPQMRYDNVTKRLYWQGEMTKTQAEAVVQLSNNPAFQLAVNELVQSLLSETTPLEVAQLESQLAESRNTLQSAEVAFQDRLDLFKIQLGLPPDLDVTTDESLLKQFQLIDPRLSSAIPGTAGVEQRIEAFLAVWAQTDEDNPDLEQLRGLVPLLQRLLQETESDGLKLVDDDFKSLNQALETRLSRLPNDLDRRRLQSDIERDRRLSELAKRSFESIRLQVNQLGQRVADDNLTAEQKKNIHISIGDLRENLLQLSQSLQVIQINLRVELIDLQDFTTTAQEAVQIGLENRLDLMNARAQVVDARRRVEVAANRLEAVLDVVVEGDIGTSGGNRPLDFRGRQSQFRAGLAFTAPLDQIAERNDYRAALIAYQRARRAYIAFEDNVKLQIRRNWRQLDLRRRNFEISRQAVRIAAQQFDLTVEEANAPAQQGQRGSSSRGLDLLNALERILNAQNSLIGNWVNYETSRLNIHRDMGIMEIDARGVWYDEYYQSPESLEGADDDDREFGSPDPATSQTGAGRGLLHLRRRNGEPGDFFGTQIGQRKADDEFQFPRIAQPNVTGEKAVRVEDRVYSAVIGGDGRGRLSDDQEPDQHAADRRPEHLDRGRHPRTVSGIGDGTGNAGKSEERDPGK